MAHVLAHSELLILKRSPDEVHVSEAYLHIHFNSCPKNPGHKEFVPVKVFNINHLPKGYHDDDIVEFIKATADMTVRLEVRMTSTDRPEFWPNRDVPYDWYNLRGRDVLRMGSGLVRGAKQYTETDNKGPCKCHKCRHSDTPSKALGKVFLATATHVVFGDIEARHTTCRFFYDEKDSPLVSLDGWTLVSQDTEGDRCLLKCSTCDVNLLERLSNMDKRRHHNWNILYHKNKNYRSEDTLVFIVSHPHGCPKQVSIGHWINRYVVSDSWTKYTYTTCTCPGSSGASVHSMRYNSDMFYGSHYHGGQNSDGTNLSGTGRDVL